MNAAALDPMIYEAHALLLFVSAAEVPPAVALGCGVAAEQLEQVTGPVLPADLDPDADPATAIRLALRLLAGLPDDVFEAEPIRRSVDEATRAYLEIRVGVTSGGRQPQPTQQDTSHRGRA